MLGQMITPCETLVALRAFVRFHSVMTPLVPGELIRSAELPRAPRVRALVRLLARVTPVTS